MKVKLSIFMCYNSGSSWWWSSFQIYPEKSLYLLVFTSLPSSLFTVSALLTCLVCETDTYGRNSPPLCLNEVQSLHPGAPLKCWFSYLPITPLQSFLQSLAASALNRQSLQTSSNLYTPVSGHGRCISNCQCALPDALLSFDPIHSSGCVPMAVIYTPCDFTDV